MNLSVETQEKSLLLHICCGPCALYPLLQFQAQGVKPTCFFYNPNIQPYVEWQRRLQSATEAANHYGLTLIAVPYQDHEAEWLKRQNDPERCLFCYDSRLEKTAQYAQENGFKSFGTTLKVSIYQNQTAIDLAGRRMAERYNISFNDCDFRHGFRTSQEIAKGMAMYRQKYCGCVCSLATSDFCDKIKRQHQVLEATLAR